VGQDAAHRKVPAALGFGQIIGRPFERGLPVGVQPVLEPEKRLLEDAE
jgi:hypothetical protein